MSVADVSETTGGNPDYIRNLLDCQAHYISSTTRT